MAFFDFLSRSTRPRAKSPRRSTPRHRRAGFEPLEERALLSVSVGPMPDAVVEESGLQPGAALAATWGDYLIERVHVGVWTPEQITDLPAWAHSQQWPEWMRPFWVQGEPMEEMEIVVIKELVHIPLRTDPRGGYRTILQVNGGFRGVTADQMLAELKALDFVDYAKLESHSPFSFRPGLQELIDAITTDAPPGDAVLLPGEAVTPGWREEDLLPGEAVTPGWREEDLLLAEPSDALREPVRITVWTAERIGDMGDWVGEEKGTQLLSPDDHADTTPLNELSAQASGAPQPPPGYPIQAVVGGGPMIDVSDYADATIDDLAREAFGENKDGAMAKMGWDLTYLYFEYQVFLEGGGNPAEFAPRNAWLRVESGRVLVELTTTEPLTYEQADRWGDVETITNWELIEQLESAGLEFAGYSGVRRRKTFNYRI